MNTRLLIYLLFIFSGFVGYLIAIMIFNKKYHCFTWYELICSLIIYYLNFLLFSKIGYMIINHNFYIPLLSINNIQETFSFLFSGYAFIGGYIGTILFILFSSIFFKWNRNNLIILYMPNMLLSYGILKIGCFVKGCCGGYLIIPIQLIETIVFILFYIYICYSMLKNKNVQIIGKNSIILFGILRFISSLFKNYNQLYSFIVIEIMCILIIIVGYKLRWKNE